MFSANGTIALEMWCNRRVEGQVVVAGDTITVITGQPTDRGCSPERARADTDLPGGAERRDTNWRRQGDSVVLIGPKTLRFYRCRRTEGSGIDSDSRPRHLRRSRARERLEGRRPGISGPYPSRPRLASLSSPSG